MPSIVTGFNNDTPNYETIALYRWYQAQGHFMIVWSGGGVDYARMWAEKLGLDPDDVIVKQRHVVACCPDERCDETVPYVDIAYDDCDVDLAKVNVKVKRLLNGISRADWNKHKTG